MESFAFKFPEAVFSKGIENCPYMKTEYKLFRVSKDMNWLRIMHELAPRLERDIDGIQLPHSTLLANRIAIYKLRDELTFRLISDLVKTGRLSKTDYDIETQDTRQKRAMMTRFNRKVWYRYYWKRLSEFHSDRYCCMICHQTSEITYSSLNPSGDNAWVFEDGRIILCHYCYQHPAEGGISYTKPPESTIGYFKKRPIMK